MKIAIDIRGTIGTKAGKGWYTYVLVKALLKHDHENEYILYSHQKNPDLAADIKRRSQSATPVRQKIFKQRGLSWHLKVLRDIKKRKPDLFWGPTSYIIPALAPKWLKTVITVHDIIAFLFPEGHNRKALFLERITLKRALKKSTNILTVSQNTRNDLIQWFGVSQRKIIVAPCAASSIFVRIKDAKKLNAVRSKHGLPDKFILAVGTLSPRKNFTRLIQAYKNLLKKHPDVHLVIVGGKGWDFESTLENIDPEKVHLVGYIEGEDLADVYNLAEMFVFPSLYEGFGIPLVEAMSCGCPVVASNNSSIPEVCGEAAILIDPYSIGSIENAMHEILSSAALRNDLIQKGLEQSKEFSWQESAQTIKSLLQNV